MKHAQTATRHPSAALLLIDVINHFEFPDGARILRQAMEIVGPLARLIARARRAGIPVIYVNDNFGQWRSESRKLIEYCTRPGAIGKEFVNRLHPSRVDYFVLKPMHSAFYGTPLELLLHHLGANRIILCGLTTNSCISCTAHDARMRDFDLIVPSDCSAAKTAKEHRQAIGQIKEVAGARVVLSRTLRLGEICPRNGK